MSVVEEELAKAATVRFDADCHRWFATTSPSTLGLFFASSV